jgi:hypothetical protein
MGLIAELLARTYHESQAKPTYSVRNIFNGWEKVEGTEEVSRRVAVPES